MKIRIALVFLILFVAGIFLVFYLKDYFLIQSHVDRARKQSLTSSQVIDAINETSTPLYGYDGKVLDRKEIYRLTHEKEVVRVFHFWASWCDPCAIELPELITFARKTAGDNSSRAGLSAPALEPGPLSGAFRPAVQIYLVSLDSDSEGLNRFSKVFPEILSKNFIQVWDKDNALSNRYGIDKLPMTLFLYPGGRLEIHDGVVNWKVLRL